MKKCTILIYLFVSLLANVNYAQWIEQPWAGPDYSIISSFSSYESIIVAGDNQSSVWFSNDYGLTWTKSNGFTNAYITSILLFKNNSQTDLTCIVGTTGGIYRSSDLGISWSKVSDYYVLSLTKIYDNIKSQLYLFAGGESYIYSSTDNGKTWNINAYGGMFQQAQAFSVLDEIVYCGSYNGIFKSDDYGNNWISIENGIKNNSISTLKAITSFNGDKSYLFAGTYGGTYRLLISDSIWTSANNGLPLVNRFEFQLDSLNGVTKIFAATEGGGVFVSRNFGETWYQINEGLENLNARELLIIDKYIFAVTASYKLYKRELSNIVVSIKDSEPKNYGYQLEQNYPNPFNPSTVIKFSVPKEQNVKLIIYDSLGKTIKNITNKIYKPGTYYYHIDFSGNASGVYYYSIITENFTKMKKMIYLK